MDSTQGTIRVVYKLPGLPAEVRVIPNTLEALQELVGGYLEGVKLDDDIHGYIDEEGRLKADPKPNFLLNGEVIVGPAVFSKADEEGDEIGFASDAEALEVCRRINEV